MKRMRWLVALVLAGAPAWAAQKVTVDQLKDLLATDRKAQKPDSDVAAELRSVELTEQLTRSTMNGMEPNVSGQLTTEQLFVLEIRSAVLPPPAVSTNATSAGFWTVTLTVVGAAASFSFSTVTVYEPPASPIWMNSPFLFDLVSK